MFHKYRSFLQQARKLFFYQIFNGILQTYLTLMKKGFTWTTIIFNQHTLHWGIECCMDLIKLLFQLPPAFPRKNHILSTAKILKCLSRIYIRVSLFEAYILYRNIVLSFNWGRYRYRWSWLWMAVNRRISKAWGVSQVISAVRNRPERWCSNKGLHRSEQWTLSMYGIFHEWQCASVL